MPKGLHGCGGRGCARWSARLAVGLAVLLGAPAHAGAEWYAGAEAARGAEASAGRLAEASAPTRSTSPPADDANARLQAADEALERGDYAAAAAGFGASFRALSPDQQRSPVGGRTIALAYDAYREAWHRGRDPEQLRAARALLAEHIAALEPAGQPAVLQEARHRLEWIDHLLELEAAAARAAAPVACPEPPPQEIPVCPAVEPAATREATPAGDEAEPRADVPPRRDPLGVALVTAGAVTLGGGVGLAIGGARVLPRARAQIEAAGRDPDDPVPQDAAYLQLHEDRGRNLMIAGGVAAGVGAALATWGIVRLVRRRTGAGPAEPRPVSVGLSPRGILLRARF